MSTGDNKKKLTQGELKDLIEAGHTQSQIAEMFGVTKQYVSQFSKRLDRLALVQAPEITTKVLDSMWDTKDAADANYTRALNLFKQDGLTPNDRVRVIGEIRQHLAFGMSVMETLFAVQESKAFMDEVLDVLDEFDPRMRKKIIERLKQKRSLRAAFVPDR